ncbi:N-alpha-acetyltransferase [Raphidocelis subcapitata]|uniref:N-alpha-acetyltransferase n=1 Tax=Raphidocelis subcapitata TaxID=307507 RepID=A0A2V0PHV9_9CHLO|nr:N-alpha-acetyltransferase [Raphidocelis subcapitata]|eukprot:GBF99159.1 N-alpha-acetyltransferase [Raphidocelis subcapitata]
MQQVVSFEPLTPERVRPLRTLNSVLFPVKYNDLVYKQALQCGDVTQLAYCEGDLVGAIMCRLEAQPGGTARLYIISLGVLAPYRCLGIGSQLLQRSIAAAAEDPAITTAALHVHAGDEEAQGWYLARGFAVQERIANYYRRLSPPDAILMARRLCAPQEEPAAAAEEPAAAAAAAGQQEPAVALSGG